MAAFEITQEQMAAFDDDGFFVVEGLLNEAETELLGKIARADQALIAGAASRADGEGGSVQLAVENELGESDIYSAIVRSRRIVDAMGAAASADPRRRPRRGYAPRPRPSLRSRRSAV